MIPVVDDGSIVSFPPGPVGHIKDIKERFEKIDKVIFGLMLTVILSMIAIIVSVTGLFLDQMRYNNAAYRDYSEKIKITESEKDIVSSLFSQNKENQELILRQQSTIIQLIDDEPRPGLSSEIVR